MGSRSRRLSDKIFLERLSKNHILASYFISSGIASFHFLLLFALISAVLAHSVPLLHDTYGK